MLDSIFLVFVLSTFSALSFGAQPKHHETKPHAYPPKVTEVYRPKKYKFVVPKGIMQNFCKDTEKFRHSHPITFSEDEYRGMVDACFRPKQESK